MLLTFGLRFGVLTTAIRGHTMCIFIVYAPKEKLVRDAKNRSDFMLEAACDRAQSVMLDQVFFSLKADKFRQFTKLLDAPPAQNPGLERLMAVKAPWGNKSAKT